MLAIRALTAALLLLAFVAALFLLRMSQFAALVGAVVAVAGREWARLMGLSGAPGIGYGLGCAALFGALVWAWWPLQLSNPIVVAVFTLSAAFWVLLAPLWLARGFRPGARRWLRSTGFLVLVPAALATVAVTPNELLLLFGLLWVADIAAFMAGRAFGRRKLAPEISPGKTWEGALAGLICVLAYAIMCAVFVPQLAEHVHGIVWLPYLAGAGALCALSVVGDLFESAVKRQAAVKDSGTWLPGHGGVLDRIDSATAMLPVGALLMHWITAI